MNQDYLWENDASLIRNEPGFAEAVKRNLFEYFMAKGTTPQEAYPNDYDAKIRAEYEAFLKSAA